MNRWEHLAGPRAAGLVIANMLTITSHVLYTWTKDAMRPTERPGRFPSALPLCQLRQPAGLDGPEKSSQGWQHADLGEDFRLERWLGGNRLPRRLRNQDGQRGVLADSIEVMHSQGGWQ